MDPNQQQLLLSYGGKEITYLDDVFKTYLWKGNDTAGRSIDVGIDMAGEGSMSWIKRRTSAAESHCINDTLRGGGKYLQSNSAAGETNDTNRFTSFTDTGFTIGSDTMTNASGSQYAGWNFRKAPGFFDLVTWTGNGVDGRTISHELGSIPGMILVKRTDTTQDWAVYHRSNGATKIFYLNSAGGIVTDSDPWNDTEPTSSVFTVGDHAMVNASSASYIAYLFAGGASTAATARSVDFYPHSKNCLLYTSDAADE